MRVPLILYLSVMLYGCMLLCSLQRCRCTQLISSQDFFSFNIFPSHINLPQALKDKSTHFTSYLAIWFEFPRIIGDKSQLINCLYIAVDCILTKNHRYFSLGVEEIFGIAFGIVKMRWCRGSVSVIVSKESLKE